MQLMVRQQLREDAVIVRIEGEIDLTVADELGSHLKTGLTTALAHPGRPLIIDLQAVTFFAKAGLDAVLACQDEGGNHGIPVRLVAENPMVTRAIEVAGLDDVLTPYPTVDNALRLTDPS